LAELGAGVRIVECRDFLDVRLADLANDLLLLFKELIGIDFDLFRLGRLRLGSLYFLGRRWVALGFLILPLELSELFKLFLFTPLLLWVDIRHDPLPLRFVLRRNNSLLSLGGRSAWLGGCRRATGSDGSIRLRLFLLEKLKSLLLFALARFDGLSDHFFFLLGGLVCFFLGHARHLQSDSHLLIHVVSSLRRLLGLDERLRLSKGEA